MIEVFGWSQEPKVVKGQGKDKGWRWKYSGDEQL